MAELKPYPAYKDSGVEWLGEIPAHWTLKRIKHLLVGRKGAIKTGPFGSQLHSSEMMDSEIKVFNQRTVIDRDIHGGLNYISMAKFNKLKAFEAFPGDLLVTTRGTIGRCIIIPSEAPRGILHPCLLRIQIDARLAYDHYIEFLIEESGLTLAQLLFMSNSTTIEVIYSDSLKETLLPLPPLSEQRAIAAFLDRETAKIDALVAKKERLIELLQEKRTALISHAVTKGLDPDAPLKDSGVEWLGKIPAHWIGLPLKRWVAVKITDGPHETPQFVPNGIDFISAEAVSNRKINFDKRRGFISPELHTYYSRKCKPIRDDILICKSGATTGKLARVDTDHEFSVWSPLAIVRSNRYRIIPRFLEMALEAEYIQTQIKRTWSAGTQPNISMGDLERLHVVAPDIEEQRKIVAYVDSKTDGFSPIIAKVREAIDRLKELRTALISAAVTGKIDVREATA